MRLLIAAFLLALLAACFKPSYGDCKVSCAVGSECPDGFACRSDGFCHTGSAADPFTACGQVIDAGIDSGTADAGPCDPVAQSGCENNLACDLAEKEHVCRNPGSDTGEQFCSQPDECAAGFHCDQSGGAPLCLKFCNNDGQCPSNNCAVPLIVQGMPVAGVTFCSAGCNLVTSGGCPEALACQIQGDGTTQVFYTRCVAPGSVALGATCSSSFDCAAGLLCTGTGSPLTCHQYCVDNSVCPIGTQCIGLMVSQGEPLVVEGVQPGVCASP